jgi:hypothetical protein
MYVLSNVFEFSASIFRLLLDEKQPAATAEKRNPRRDIRIVLAVKVAVLASLDPMIPFSTGAPLALSCHKRRRLPRFQGRDEPDVNGARVDIWRGSRQIGVESCG